MGKRNVLKNEKRQNEKLPARALRSWPLTKAVSYYHITPHLLTSWSFAMPSITRQLLCVTAFQSLPGVSHLKVSNSEDLSWVDMNLVTRKSSKLEGHKCYKGEEHILKLVKKEKMDQEPGNSCPSARNTFLITTPYSFVSFSYFNLLGMSIAQTMQLHSFLTEPLGRPWIQPCPHRRLVEWTTPSTPKAG